MNGDTADTEPDGDGSPGRDLRYTAHEEQNIRIDRNLDGSGRLARGDVTRMSVLKFSSKHPPRAERDPEFEFRPAPVKPASDATIPPIPAAAADPADAPKDSLFDKVKRLLG
jgi:hypothetical protein